MSVFIPCCISLGIQPVLRFTGLWLWGSPDDSPVDFYSLVVLDLGQICALLYKVWALNFIQQSGVAFLDPHREKLTPLREEERRVSWHSCTSYSGSPGEADV